MATKTNKVKTVAQRREELEKQLEDLETLELIEEAITGYIERAERERGYYLSESYQDGYETEQARNSDGELLYEVTGEWKHYTLAKLTERGLAIDSEGVKPYYKPIYKEREVKREDLNEYSRRRVEAWDRVITFLNRYLEEA